jgi:thioredoxin 1
MPTVANDENFALLTNDGNVVVDFWGPRCKPCLALMPGVEALEEEADGSFRLVTVDASKNQGVCRELRVFSLPTFVLMKDGEELARLTGGQLTLSDLKSAIKAELA